MLDLLFALSAIVVGGISGWLLRGIRRAVTRSDELTAQEATAKRVLTQLYDLTNNVAAGVDAHSLQMRRITDDLDSLDPSDVGAVVSAISRIVESNQHIQQKLDTAEQRLKEQAVELECHATEARTDALTGLHNRRSFDDQLEHFADALRHKGQTVSLALFDIDHFKGFNDVYGHLAGDEVLRQLGKIVAEADSRFFPTRYGGEEFAILAPGVTGEELQPFIERLRLRIAKHRFFFNGRDLRATVSLGIATLQLGEEAAAFVERADQALYASKEAGRNCTHFHDGRAITRVRCAIQGGIRELQVQVRRSGRTNELGRGFRFASPAHGAGNEQVVLADRAVLVGVIDTAIANHQPRTLLRCTIDGLDRIRERYGVAVSQKVLELTVYFVDEIKDDSHLLADLSNGTLALLLNHEEGHVTRRMTEAIERAISQLRIREMDEGWSIRCETVSMRDFASAEELISQDEEKNASSIC